MITTRNHRLTTLAVIVYMVIGLMITSSLTSCTDASVSRFTSLGDSHRIELINCDGSVTHSWISTGKVQSSTHSDGYFFMDSETNTLVEISGNVIITRIQ